MVFVFDTPLAYFRACDPGVMLRQIDYFKINFIH